MNLDFPGLNTSGVKVSSGGQCHPSRASPHGAQVSPPFLAGLWGRDCPAEWPQSLITAQRTGSKPQGAHDNDTDPVILPGVPAAGKVTTVPLSDLGKVLRRPGGDTKEQHR